MMDKNNIGMRKEKAKTLNKYENKQNMSIHIGKVFQEYRLKNNMTQNDVSNCTGLEPRHISQLERGLTKGSIHTLIKLCDAYEITSDVVLFDLLSTKTKEKVEMFDEKFKRLSKRDKETILHLMDYLLSQ